MIEGLVIRRDSGRGRSVSWAVGRVGPLVGGMRIIEG